VEATTIDPDQDVPHPPYSAREVADLAGITYRQVDYWARTDLLRPSVTDATGSGSRRRYSHMDLVILRLLKRLLDAGLSLEKIRRSLDAIKQSLDSVVIFHPHTALMVSDQEIRVANDENVILKYIREHSDQAWWVFPLEYDEPPDAVPT
jgi:DNA-binding transcriptional MerR regulator